MSKIKILSSNQLKIIACITMLIDHIGFYLLPNVGILRLIGGFSYMYGFYGCMCAVFASAPTLNKTDAPEWLKKFDIIPVRTLCMAIPLILYGINDLTDLIFYFIGLALLLFYFEKRGKAKLKYFFYIFYPAHLLILHLIYFLL